MIDYRLQGKKSHFLLSIYSADSIDCSTRAAHHSSPFDFEFISQTFPCLCLLLLPPPPTIFSASPFATPPSLPLGPPGSAQLDSLRLQIEKLFQKWKWGSLVAAQRLAYPQGTASNLGEEHGYLSKKARDCEDIVHKHLEIAYGIWMAHSELQRSQQWQLELTRAFAREHQRREEVQEQFERLRQEAKQLQAQVDYLSRCQWPREMALWPPDRTPIGKDVIMELKAPKEDLSDRSATGAERWDFEHLVSKWKKVVREDKSRKNGGLAAYPRPPEASEKPPPPPSTPSQAAIAETTSQNKKAKGALNGTDTRRRNGRTQFVTSLADKDDTVREFKAPSTNGNR